MKQNSASETETVDLLSLLDPISLIQFAVSLACSSMQGFTECQLLYTVIGAELVWQLLSSGVSRILYASGAQHDALRHM